MANKKRNIYKKGKSNNNSSNGRKDSRKPDKYPRPESYKTQRIREEASAAFRINLPMMHLPLHRGTQIIARNIGLPKVFALKTSDNTNTGSTLQTALDDINVLLERKLRERELAFDNALYLSDSVDSYFANVINMLTTYYTEAHWSSLPFAHTYTYLHATLSEDKRALIKMADMLALTPRPAALDLLIHKLTVPLQPDQGGSIFAAAPQTGSLLTNFEDNYDAIQASFEEELTAIGVMHGVPAPLPVGPVSHDEGLFNALVHNVPLTNDLAPATQQEVFPHALSAEGRVIFAGRVLDEIVLYGFAPFFNHATTTTTNSWEGLAGTNGGGSALRCLIETASPIRPLGVDGALDSQGNINQEIIAGSYYMVIKNIAAPGDCSHSLPKTPFVSVPGIVSMEVRLRALLATIFEVPMPAVLE